MSDNNRNSLPEKDGESSVFLSKVRELSRRQKLTAVGLMLLLSLGVLGAVTNSSDKNGEGLFSRIASAVGWKESKSDRIAEVVQPPTGPLQLSKEYIYAGSRMLSTEDYGVAQPNPSPTTSNGGGTGGSNNPTPPPTPTPNATPPPISNNFSPVGVLYAADTNAHTISGWSYDPDNTSVYNVVRFYIHGPAGSGTLIGDIAADEPSAASNVSGNHGFTFQIPSQYANGQTHFIYAYGLDTGTNSMALLSNSPQAFNSGTPICKATQADVTMCQWNGGNWDAENCQCTYLENEKR